MNKKAFTLAEILGVIVVIGLLLTIAAPLIINKLRENSSIAEEVGNKIVYNAAGQYIDEHKESFPNGKSYCITISSLIEEGKLISPVKNIRTSETIDSYSVLVIIQNNGSKDYKLMKDNECTTEISTPDINLETDSPTIIYRHNKNYTDIGDPIFSGTKNVWCRANESHQGWCYVSEEYGQNSCTDYSEGFSSQNECLNYIYGWGEKYTCKQGTIPAYNSCIEDNVGYNDRDSCLAALDGDENKTCEQGTVTVEGAGEYTTNPSTLNKKIYLKHDVVNNIITTSYVCFVTDTEHCLQGWIDECQLVERYDEETDEDTSYCTFTGNKTVYNKNKAVLQSQETWFNSHDGSCWIDEDDFSIRCEGGEFQKVEANADGIVKVEVDSYEGFERCIVWNDFVRCDFQDAASG